MKEKKSVISVVIDGVSGIFLPIINLLSAAGILKGVLAILTAANILSGAGETYVVLNAMADSLFYFLPIILAFTAAKKFGSDPFIAMVIGGVLLYPALTDLFEAGTSIFFAGIPMKAVIYHSSVIPIILAAGLLSYVERLAYKILPDMIKGFLAPLICIIVVGLVTLFVFGPIGNVIGDGMAAAYEFLYGISPMIAGGILGAVIQPMVIFGFHWSLVLVAMNNVSVKGSDTILALIGPAVFAQAGAALAVCLKSKDKNFRSICLSAVLSACFGVTEPAMFGVNLPLKKPMIAVCIGGGVGGAVAGLSGAQAMAFAFPSLVTLPVFLGNGFGLYVISCMVGFLTAFTLAMVLKYDVAKDEAPQAD
ncbi:PTS transporter subunit EIIC [Lacrimispora sp.]|uniref:PTS transporter subunit EIIC n=1 Tax=Lacrimispora sp. TaxID=2719234 RepID=UPI002FDAE8E4